MDTNNFDLKPINPNDFRSSSSAFRGFTFNKTNGIIFGALLSNELKIQDNDEIIFATNQKRWFFTIGENGGFKIRKYKGQQFRALSSRGIMTKISLDVGIKIGGRSQISMDRIPSNGLLWYEILK